MLPAAQLRPSLLLPLVFMLAACGGGTSIPKGTTTGQSARSPASNQTASDQFPADQGNSDDAAKNPTLGGTPPQIDITIEPEFIQAGTPVTLSWTAYNADRCSAIGGPWQGSQPTTGQLEVSGIDTTTRFTIQCSNSGASATANALTVITDPTVRWIPPTETVQGEPLENLAGYELLYGPEAGNYAGTIMIDDPEQTEVELDLPGGGYYLAMVAYDTDYVRSDLSNEVYKLLGD